MIRKSVYFEDDLERKGREIAEKEGVSFSRLVRKAVKNYLETEHGADVKAAKGIINPGINMVDELSLKDGQNEPAKRDTVPPHQEIDWARCFAEAAIYHKPKV